MAETIKQQIQFQLNISGNRNVAKAIDDISRAQIKLNKEALKDKGARALKDLKIELRHYGVSVKQVTRWETLRKQALQGSASALKILKHETRATIEKQAKFNKSTRRSVFWVRNLRNQTTKGGVAFSVFRSKLLLASFAVGLYSRSIGALANLIGEQEKAERKLSTALGKTSKSLLAYASAQQKLTMFGDEQIINEMSQIAAFTNNEKAIAKLTTAALDLSAAKGIDLASATDLLTKSIFSSTNSLSRYGITAEGAVGRTERLTSVTEKIAALYGGQARQQADTFVGSVAQLGTSMGDLGERIGKTFLPQLHAATKLMKDFTDSLTDEKIKAYGTALVTVTGALGLYSLWTLIASKNTVKLGRAMKVTGVGLVIAGLGFAIDKLGLFGESSEDLAKELEKLEGEMGDLNSKAGDSIALQNKFAISGIRLSSQLASLGTLERERLVLAEKMKQVLKELGFEGEDYLSNTANITRAVEENIEVGAKYNEVLLQQQKLLEKMELAKFSQRLQTTSIAFGALSETAQMFWDNQQAGWDREMQNLKNSDSFKRKSKRAQEKDIKDLEDKQRGAKQKQWKMQQALSMSQIVMDTASAVMSIWAQVPKFDFGISAGLLSKFVMGMGAFQLGMVANQQMPAFAKGGDFIADRPQPILVGEAGRERVTITPVDRPDSMALGSMGGVNINFSGNVLSQDFIEDEAIPMIKEAIRRGADIGVA